MARRAKEFRKPPFFKFNVADWLSSRWVQRMTAEQRGWFIAMMAESWASEKTCYLVNTAEAIEMAAGLHVNSDSPRAIAEVERFRSSGQIVIDRFETTSDGKYIFNARLLKEFEDLLAHRLKRQKAGYRGARSKWNSKKELDVVKRYGNAMHEDGNARQTETRDKRLEAETRDERQETEKTVSSAASAEPNSEPGKVDSSSSGNGQQSRQDALGRADTAGTLPLIDKTEYRVTKAEVDEWQRLYPAVDCKQEFRSMKGWLLANPHNRKTARGIKRFINGWLEREQNKAKPINKATGKANLDQLYGESSTSAETAPH